MYLISLIIPIYNAEKDLDNTINSIINQSIGFENIELILVDDNSKDNSRKIIEKYAKKFSNIIPVYSKTNHGFPGYGRNVGLEKSTTEFIMFMDNDDELDEDICKKLYETITTENADVVCCDKVNVDFLGEIKRNITYTNGIEKDDKIIIIGENIPLFKSISVWNKIYRKKIILQNNLKFIENSAADDFVFTMQYFFKSDKLIYLKNYFGYYWNIKSDSLSHIVTKELMDDFLNVNQIILNMVKKEKKSHLLNEIFKENIPYLIMQSSYLKVNKKEFREILKKIHDFEKEIDFNLKLNPSWLNIINYFILHENYNIVILLLRVIDKVRSSKTLKRINRNI
ncbi:glycosyltransferase family 2 protein [uncultured Methanobrevibacter sp.]|uniref:glycosyltransferase family 2 protein n=1 Tax=uncultured Methanobrevibacter sp. TaxID=253161 RepID=UPI0025F44EB1|nr:glycosyltransferase family 2 protein [uncultured Methanobrevibacter sp.]